MSERKWIDVMPGQLIVAWLSCGLPSAVAAKLTVEMYGSTNDVRVVNNPINDEDEDNQRFASDVGDPQRVSVSETELLVHRN